MLFKISIGYTNIDTMQIKSRLSVSIKFLTSKSEQTVIAYACHGHTLHLLTALSDRLVTLLEVSEREEGRWVPDNNNNTNNNNNNNVCKGRFISTNT